MSGLSYLSIHLVYSVCLTVSLLSSTVEFRGQLLGISQLSSSALLRQGLLFVLLLGHILQARYSGPFLSLPPILLIGLIELYMRAPSCGFWGSKSGPDLSS